MKFSKYLIIAGILSIVSCNTLKRTNDPFKDQRIKPVLITEKVQFDTDDPAIWVHPENPEKSLIIGTDKETGGGLYVFDLQGKIVNKVTGLQRPNNVDLAYGFAFNGRKVDIAATTERESNKVKIYLVPEMKELGEISVFEGEAERDPMGIAFYKNPNTHEIDAMVGRKSGPSGSYLWQYRLVEKNGEITGELVRKFGEFSGKKEMEAIAVDQELGYVYVADEQFGIRKYYADPSKGNQELALFGTKDFESDHEGISIYDAGNGTGYILISNQQADTFNVYRREGDHGNPNRHARIAEIPVSTFESDGSEVTNVNLGPKFPKGLFVAMSNGKTFHYYDWRDFQKIIDAAVSKSK